MHAPLGSTAILQDLPDIAACASNAAGCVSRQAILDRRGQVFGYQLLLHQPSSKAGGAQNHLAASAMSDTLALFGIDRYTGGSPAFVPCTEELLIQKLVANLPSSLTVLEIPQDLELSPPLLHACRDLKRAGFRFALADFQSHNVQHPLLELADFVKINAGHFEATEWERLCWALKIAHVTLIADRVHTQADYKRAHATGIRYFQGFYFCSPDMIPNSRVPANRLYHFEILRQLVTEPLDLAALCPLVMRDASLVYRVLRLANSPLYAVSRPVTSIKSAIMILGDTAFRRIATLAIQCALNEGRPTEILRMALVRAHFCASAAPSSGLDPDEQYLLGLLSMLPAMLAVPMKTIVRELPIRTAIHEALLGLDSKERCLLSWIESIEANRARDAGNILETYGLNQLELLQCFTESLLANGSDSAFGT